MDLMMLEASNTTTSSTGLIILAVVLVLIAVIAVILVSKNKKNKTKQTSKVKVDDVLIENILKLFPSENVKSVSSDVSRVKFEVNDLDLVDLDAVKQISNGVFVTGNNIKVMFKDSADEIVEKLNTYYK